MIFQKDYTIKQKTTDGLYLGLQIQGDGTPFAFNYVYYHYWPCRKGGHHHRRNYAVCECGALFRKKRNRRVSKEIKRFYPRYWWCRNITRHPEGVPMPF